MGVLVALPTGPVGFLCVKRAITQGMKSAIISGLGSATADLFYSIVVVFSITVISGFLIKFSNTLLLIGGIFLLILSYRTYKRSDRVHEVETSTGYVNDFLSTFFLTFTNPTLIVSFAFLCTMLGLQHAEGNFSASLAFVVGIFAGSLLWWMGVSFVVYLMSNRFTDNTLRKVNVFASLVILVSGLFILSSLLW